MRSTFEIFTVLGFLNIFCQGQNYIIEDPENRDYILQQHTSTDSSIPFHQIANLHQGVGIQPADFSIPSDLQTSDLPLHLQQTLLQYRPQSVKTSSNDNFQNTILNVAEPLGSNDYVKPSTHRPNYSHLLSHRNLQNSLQTPANDLLELPQLTNDNLYKFDENTFDVEQNEQKVIRSATNVSTTKSDKKYILENYRPSNLLHLLEPSIENSKYNRQDIESDNDPTEDYEFHTKSNLNRNSEEKSSDKENQNYIDDEEYDDDYLEEDDENSKENTDYDVDQTEDQETKNKTYEILTVKPMLTTQDNAYQDFVDTDFMDTTTQESASSDINTQLPIMLFSMKKENRVFEMNSKPLTTEGAVKKYNTTDEKKNFSEYVVSVVTSKTIVNNTIISPVTITQLPTSSPIKSNDHKEESSTDSWIIVASVQTSKSISGARYLPSSVVEQHNTNKSLIEPDNNTKHFETENDNWSIETTTSEIMTTNLKSSTKFKTSTESLIDKLDRVQSDLSSGLLAGGFKNENIAVIDENAPMKIDTITGVKPTSSPIRSTTKPYPQVNIRKFNAGNRPSRPKSKEINSNRRKFTSTTTAKPSSASDILKEENLKDSMSILQNVKPVDDISDLLPPDYKLSKPAENNISNILKNTKIVDDISALLPPGYVLPKPTSTENTLGSILSRAKPVEDISDLLPPGFKSSIPVSSKISSTNILAKAKPVEDISSLLPSGFKLKTEESNNSKEPSKNPKPELEENNVSKVFFKAKPIANISSLLPPGFKQQKQNHVEKSVTNLLAKAKPVDDISFLLPPGYRGVVGNTKGYKGTTTLTPPSYSTPNNLLPSGYKLEDKNNQSSENLPPLTNTTASDMNLNITAKPKEIKLVFPSRPGGGSRKSSRSTTVKTPVNGETNKPTLRTIQKGWPVRASTEFSGWPTPSTTPISIEKLLEAARTATTSTSTTVPITVSSTRSTTKPTTTTPKPTTPGVCVGECDLAGIIKLVGGVKWLPELLDRNTKEWQILANDVQDELESIYSSSPMLKNWYRKIRIDGFSEGSVLVDYLVELSEVGKKVDTQEIKHMFHESLLEHIQNNSSREGKSLNETKTIGRISLGHFELDPKFTDFVVIPKQSVPTISYADDILLPQWAIAVIVIGLASLLFVIIFGVTVLVNRHKSAKKSPAPLTEDMLNELNKNHMGGFENYEVDDFYNLEDVWSDKPYEQKSHKKRTNDSIYDNSMSNLYDSWRSQWNGTYDNRQDGTINNSQHPGYVGSRRPKYDTNF